MKWNTADRNRRNDNHAMKRLHQFLLIGTFLPLCWLAMIRPVFPSACILGTASAQRSGLAQPQAKSIIEPSTLPSPCFSYRWSWKWP